MVEGLTQYGVPRFHQSTEMEGAQILRILVGGSVS